MTPEFEQAVELALLRKACCLQRGAIKRVLLGAPPPLLPKQNQMAIRTGHRRGPFTESELARALEKRSEACPRDGSGARTNMYARGTKVTRTPIAP